MAMISRASASPAFCFDELNEACLTYLQGRTLSASMNLRPLSEHDLEKVEAINALTYGGHDYIADEFSFWLERSGIDVWTVAADYDGELAGFEILKLYDFGKTGWLEALRVHPQWRNRGIATTLQKKLIETAFALQLPCVRYTTATANVASRRLAESCKLCCVTSWAYTVPRQRVSLPSFLGRVQAVQARLSKRWAIPALSPHTCKSSDEIFNLLQGLGVKYLLQSWWKAFDFTRANIEKLLSEGAHEEPLVVSEPGSSTGSISWALLKRDALGVTLWATIYANDMFSTLAHMIAQLDLGVRNGATSAMIMYDPNLEPDMHRFNIADRCKTILDEEGLESVAKCVLLFERRFGF